MRRRLETSRTIDAAFQIIGGGRLPGTDHHPDRTGHRRQSRARRLPLPLQAGAHRSGHPRLPAAGQSVHADAYPAALKVCDI